MDDEDAANAEDAWEAALEILEGDDCNAAGLSVLERANSVLAGRRDAESAVRRAEVLEGIAFCHLEAGDGDAAARTVDELLSSEWPPEALQHRLGAATMTASTGILSNSEVAEMASRAVSVGEGTEDDHCRGLLAELLKLQAIAVLADDATQSQTLLLRVVDEFHDVDNPLDTAQDRLTDPYFRGRLLLDQPGQLSAAEAAFRAAIADGDAAAWLELALVLSWHSGREGEEEQALQEALDAEQDPERRAAAGYFLGCLLHYHRKDLSAAREAFGRATTGAGEYSTWAVKELANIAVLQRDHQARRQLISELAGRALEEFDADARRKDHKVAVALSRLGYARPAIAIRAWRWRRQRDREQRKRATS